MIKRFTLFLVAGLVCMAGASENPHAKAFSHKAASEAGATKVRAAKTKAKSAALKAAESSDDPRLRYLPAYEIVSVWNEDTEGWEAVSRYDYTYDSFGRIRYVDEHNVNNVASPRFSRISYEYDAFGNQTSEITQQTTDGGTTWTNSEKRAWQYDDVVTNYMTEYLIYSWLSNDWFITLGNAYPIERNDAGIPVKVTRQSYYAGGYDPIATVTNVPAEDNSSVVSMLIDEVDYSTLEWEVLVDLRNIKWAVTNNQILNFDVEDYAFGQNRIAYALNYTGDVLDAVITGEYPNDFEGSLTFDFMNTDYMQHSREYTDEATGSFMQKFYLEYLDGGNTYTEEETYTYTYDEHGELIEERGQYIYDGRLTGEEAIQYKLTYNEDGAVETRIMAWYDYEEDTYTEDLRIDCYDFQAFAGVNSVTAGNAIDCRVEGRDVYVAAPGSSVCNVLALDGKSVAAAAGQDAYSFTLDGLAAGMYIVRVSSANDTRSFKVVVR